MTTETYSGTIYSSNKLQPEGFKASHRRSFLRGIGKHALQSVTSGIAAVKQYVHELGDRWEATKQAPPENNWEEMYPPAAYDAPGLTALDAMLEKPYRLNWLEQKEHAFVDGMVTLYETAATAGRAVARAVVQQHTGN